MAALDRVPVVDDAKSRDESVAAWGVLAVIATVGLDALTTMVGLALVPALVERNPFARVLFAHVGVPAGVLLVSTAVVCLIVVVTETAARSVEDATIYGRHAGGLVQWVGYGIPSVLSLVVGVHNLFLVLAYHGGV